MATSILAVSTKRSVLLLLLLLLLLLASAGEAVTAASSARRVPSPRASKLFWGVHGVCVCGCVERSSLLQQVSLALSYRGYKADAHLGDEKSSAAAGAAASAAAAACSCPSAALAEAASSAASLTTETDLVAVAAAAAAAAAASPKSRCPATGAPSWRACVAKPVKSASHCGATAQLAAPGPSTLCVFVWVVA